MSVKAVKVCSNRSKATAAFFVRWERSNVRPNEAEMNVANSFRNIFERHSRADLRAWFGHCLRANAGSCTGG